MGTVSGQTPPVKIAVDAMGGDYAPQEVIKGAVEAAREFSNIEIVLVGPKETVEKELIQYPTDGLKITLVPAEETIAMNEDPVRAIRRKPNSSIVVGINLVKEGKAQAFVSGGSTGAVAAAALLILGRKKRIARPALGAMFESPRGPAILLDVGANADCKPQNLLQFAQMGSAYMQRIHGIENPRVGLLSSGEESIKGNKLTRTAHLLLAKSSLNFIGNVEGRDVPTGAADVIVTDGFTGNVVIKLAEGLAGMLAEFLKNSHSGASLLKNRRLLNHTAGAMLLGVEGNVIITHGKSDASMIKYSIQLAGRMIEQKVTEAIGSAVA